MAHTPAITTLVEPVDKQQPDEPLNAYTRFCRYRDQLNPGDDPRTTNTVNGERISARSLPLIAAAFGVSERAIRDQAQRYRWRERARAYDDERRAERDADHEAKIAAHAQQLAEAELATAEDMLTYVRSSVRTAAATGDVLAAEDVPKWADSAIKLRQAAQKAPDHVRAVYRSATTSTTTTAGDGTTASAVELDVDVPEIRGLTPDRQRERLGEWLASIERSHRYRARDTTEHE